MWKKAKKVAMKIKERRGKEGRDIADSLCNLHIGFGIKIRQQKSLKDCIFLCYSFCLWLELFAKKLL
jgi:hypothetical protein